MNSFSSRHIGLSENEVNEMLKSIGEDSIDSLISKTIPSHIRLNRDLLIDDEISEFECLNHQQRNGVGPCQF